MAGELTKKQSELWKVAGSKLSEVGGMGKVMRSPDRKVENTLMWALKESSKLRGTGYDDEMTDEYCQKLIDIVS